MFEVEIALCKSAKEALTSQLDDCMRHLEEFCDTFGGEAADACEQDTVKLKISVSTFNASLKYLVEQMQELGRQLDGKEKSENG